MPSVLAKLLAIAACVALATASALPVDVQSQPLETRDFKYCPGLNGYTYTSPRGLSTWKIRCDTDTFSNGGQQKVVEANDFEDCIGRCGNAQNSNWCNFAAFPGNVKKPGPCYLKKGNGEVVKDERTKGIKLAIRQ
ncbi:hypothetical protein PRZ48_014869 [Zasmidium cellare]|uniref:Apple domain-containing protein n=1 Tax=Zasmidium cellare TaxID=395010 RepID=A0ABR0DWX9_ZASCE|nr:hypothetical protein PRZ48_014869 [Zasmidium cellare]